MISGFHPLQHGLQAPVAKKKAAPAKRNTSEEVVPQTAAEKVTAAMSDALKEAGLARTASITLGGLDYADHLSQAIKSHADGIEKFYSEVQTALKEKAEDKVLNKLLKKIEEKSQNTKKLQAHQLGFQLYVKIFCANVPPPDNANLNTALMDSVSQSFSHLSLKKEQPIVTRISVF